MPAVIQKVAIVVPMIFPARFAFCIFAMAEEMEQNTIGTTTQNIRLVKMVPRGFNFWEKSGAKKPARHPAMIPSNIQRRKP